jgi:Protein of unknown function (DUF1524)
VGDGDLCSRPLDECVEIAYGLLGGEVGRVARYFLAALELAKAGAGDSELVPNQNEEVVNLEHVFPKNANLSVWLPFKGVEDPQAWATRLGNMVLLKKSENGKIGNRPFSFKKPILSSSSLSLTQEVGNQGRWTPVEIEKRQRGLATRAVIAWPR